MTKAKSQVFKSEQSLAKQKKRIYKRQRRMKTLRFLMFFVSLCVFLYVGAEAKAELTTSSANQPIECLLQNPQLPNGCEAVSMTMLLRSYGVLADAGELAMNYVPRGDFSYRANVRYAPDPEDAYVGDPSSKRGGWYCFEKPLVEGTNRYLSVLGSDLRAKKVSGLSIQKLEKYLDKGSPVVVWLTSDYQPPRFNDKFTWVLADGRKYTPYNNLHCVLLTEIENDNVHIADPLQGEKVISKVLFEQLFEQMGRRAVVIK